MSEVYIKEPVTSGKAILRTTHGDLEVEMWATECPKACRNFCQMILEGHYNGTIFHRVIKDFIIQGGDATNTGDGCESIYGEPYPDEIHSRLKFRYRGMMGVASAGKGTKTNGSQFFVVLNRTPSLDGKHTLFAKVVGQTVYNLVRMSEVEVDKRDRPLDPPRILRAELVWDPFGDLEPRRIPEPPKALSAGPAEVHRRAPVKKKHMLSFGDEEDDASDDEEEKAPAPKGKSAHDLLVDPKLLKEAAYPEQKKQQGKRSRPGEQVVTKEAGSAAKRHASSSSAPASAPAKAKPAAPESESEEYSDSDDSENEGGSIAKAKANKRREEINALKKQIASVGASGKEEAQPKKASSALEELRAGYKMRTARVAPTDKQGKKAEAAGMTALLKSFRNRLKDTVEQAADVQADAEEQKAEKKEAEEGTFSSIWAEGDEEADKDWLAGGGLKFHVSADKAFKLDRDRAQGTLEIFDPLLHGGNSEVLADARKKASDKLAPIRTKLSQREKPKEDNRDRRRR